MTPQYNVILSKLAESKFDKLIHSDRKLGEQVAKAIDRVASNPDLGELLKGEWKAIANIELAAIESSIALTVSSSCCTLLRLTIARISTANPRSRDLSQPFVRLRDELVQLKRDRFQFCAPWSGASVES